MKKFIMLIVFLLIAGSTHAALKECNVGADSWWKGLGHSGQRPIPSGATIWVLEGQMEVSSLNGKGKPGGRCFLRKGETIIVPKGFDPSVRNPSSSQEEKMKLAFILRCGNPIVSKFRLTAQKREQPVPVAEARIEAPAPKVAYKPLLDGMDTRAEFVPTEVAVVAPTRIITVVETPVVRYVERYVERDSQVYSYQPIRRAPGFTPPTLTYTPPPVYTPPPPRPRREPGFTPPTLTYTPPPVYYTPPPVYTPPTTRRPPGSIVPPTITPPRGGPINPAPGPAPGPVNPAP